MSIGVSGAIHLIGHIFMMADGFLQFRVLIRVLEFSFPFRIIPEIHLF